ncbi:MAG: hypothetical protein ACYDER_23150 [Ktedonobacteraceae bacterium]
MNKEEAQKYLRQLGEALQQRQMTGEILVNDHNADFVAQPD